MLSNGLVGLVQSILEFILSIVQLLQGSIQNQTIVDHSLNLFCCQDVILCSVLVFSQVLVDDGRDEGSQLLRGLVLAIAAYDTGNSILDPVLNLFFGDMFGSLQMISDDVVHNLDHISFCRSIGMLLQVILKSSLDSSSNITIA